MDSPQNKIQYDLFSTHTHKHLFMYTIANKHLHPPSSLLDAPCSPAALYQYINYMHKSIGTAVFPALG